MKRPKFDMPSTSTLWMIFSLLGTLCVLFASAFVVWFGVFDPVVPNLKFESGRAVIIKDKDGNPAAVESRRIVCMDARSDVKGRIYGELTEIPPQLEEKSISQDGSVIHAEPRRFSMGVTFITLHPGCWERKHTWQLPRGIQADHSYTKETHFEVCNVIGRCIPVPWPPMKLPEGITR